MCVRVCVCVCVCVHRLNYKWETLEKVGVHNPVMFNPPLEPNDIRQGAIGECV